MTDQRGQGVSAVTLPATRTARGHLPAFVRSAVLPLRIFTPLGVGAVGVGVVCAALALWLDWGEMLAIAVVALLALLAAVPFVIGRSDYSVRVELASPRVIVGEQAVGRVVVRNESGRGAASTLLQFPVGAVTAEFRVPRLAAGAEHDDLFTIPTQRRAVLTLGPVVSVRSDPLGLLRRRKAWTQPTELYVHPRSISLSSDTTGILRDLEGLPTRDLADDDVSFHALREYSPGDDLRHVHWKSTARTQKLMIRQFEQTRRSHLVLALSTSAVDYADPEEFELAVSAVASIGVAALRDGKALTVLTGSGAASTATATRLLDRLSAVELDGAQPLADVARSIAREAPGASVVTFVTGAGTDPAAVRLAAQRVPATARALCVRATVDGMLSRKVIGDVPIVDVPELGSLRMAMRAVTA